MGGRLFIVATPIGNLGDLTLRAREILASASVIACEDTRVTRKLLSHFEIHTPTVSWHAHSKVAATEGLIERLLAGHDVALVTDAGTPSISDPGHVLVLAALEANIEIIPIPGASAVLAAASASGLVSGRFVFLGFLPRTEAEQRELLAPFVRLGIPLILFESAERTPRTLAVLARVLGPRPACVARELTKKFEAFDRSSLSDLALRYQSVKIRGEVVIVVGASLPEDHARDADEATDDEVAQKIDALLIQRVPVREIAQMISGAFGVPRQEAYRRVLARRSRSEGAERDEDPD